MARVMMIGYGPLPQRGLKLFMAPSLRTRHFLHGVLEGGHTVNLFTLPLPGTEGEEGEVAAMKPDQYEGLQYQRFTSHLGEFAIQTLNDMVAELKPDAIVGVNSYPSYVGSMLATTVPLWCDLNGYWMAEMQGRCYVEGDDDRLMSAWAIERSILRRADKFSAVSRPQLHAVLGEMAAIGRLNRHTFTYQFGAHIPNAAHKWEGPEDENSQPILRGPIVPYDAFVILWSGGFNLWTDIDMLMGAMNELMDRYPQVHFVSTGGQLHGVDTRTYQLFEEAVEASPHKDRYHRLGWVNSEDIPQIYRESDLGINVDGMNYETMFGARNRINAMAAESLAIVTTLGSEISEWLHDGNAALTAEMGNMKSLVDAIEPYVEQREGLRVFSDRAEKIMEEDFSYSRTTRALRAWLENPTLAPDNEAKIKQAGGELSDLKATSINALESQAVLLENHDPRELMRIEREHEMMLNRPWRRAVRKIRRLLGS